MLVVGREEFDAVLEILQKGRHLSVDTETTGLYPWKRDRLFSVQFSDALEDYYFNFQDYPTGEKGLPFEWILRFQPLFVDKTIFIQNAKFDMAFLWKEGIRFEGCDIHDTEVVGRLVRNDHLKYSLDEQAKRELGAAKDDAVMEYLKKHKCFTSTIVPGKDTVYKAFHFDQVPFDIISKYGCKDTRLTYDLGMKQLEQITALHVEAGEQPYTMNNVYVMEKALTHACFEMERVGIRIDRRYCEEAVEFESQRICEAEKRFQEITKTELTDSGKCLGPIFSSLGFQPELTASGEHEITDSFLSGVSHPLGEIIQTYRDARKRANTYFKSFLYFAGEDDIVHANMKQSGTKTGRFSYIEPNLQNIPARGEENVKFPIRRAFIPQDGFFFLSIDYKQMEFRMMLDEAGQHDLIAKIKAGHDPHDATAELTGLSRSAAKTLNFAILYGMGLVNLAFAILKLTPEENALLKKYEALPDKRTAVIYFNPEEMFLVGVLLGKMRDFKSRYFRALPMVENFILQCTGVVKQRGAISPGNGWIKTWFGRRSYFSEDKWAYRAANAKIQGGSADVVKLAMNAIHVLLNNKKSKMCVQIHDEILFEMSFDEMDLIEDILKIMETTYPHRFIPLTCSVAHSLKSFHDIIEEDPRKGILGEATRDQIQRKDLPSASGAAEYLGREDSAKGH